MTNTSLYFDAKGERERSLAIAYAQAELICEFRDRARHERMAIDSTFADCTIYRRSALYEHEAKAELFEAICEAILGGELV